MHTAESLSAKWLYRWVVRPGAVNATVPIQPPHGRTQVYLPSEMEMQWVDGRRRGKLCATARNPSMERSAMVWLNYSKRAWLPGGRPAPKLEPTEQAVLSHFQLSKRGDTDDTGERLFETVPIEPLHGIARHPFARVGCGRGPGPGPGPGPVNLYKIDFLVLHNNCGANDPKPRTIYFDMGASVGFKDVPGGIYGKMPQNGNGGGASIPLFYRLLQDRCLEPDLIFAWEPLTNTTEAEFWGELPPQIRRKVSFRNMAVKEGSVTHALSVANSEPDQSHAHNEASFLRTLKLVATPDDWVVVKLDIDTPAVEQTIVAVLAELPAIAALVDEFFFEYHFHWEGPSFGWGWATEGNVDSALGLLYRLRTLGVRSHFWI
jgi:hypothetical protein